MAIHDQNGAPLAVGDRVRVECVVASMHEALNCPDLELTTVTPMYAHEYGTRLLLMSSQVERVAPDAAPFEETPEPAPRKKR